MRRPKPKFRVGQVVFASLVRWDGKRHELYGRIDRLWGKGPHAANVAGMRWGMDELRPLTDKEIGPRRGVARERSEQGGKRG